MPQITRPQVHRIVYELLPHKHWTPAALLAWLQETQRRNERAKRSHAKRRWLRRLVQVLTGMLVGAT